MLDAYEYFKFFGEYLQSEIKKIKKKLRKNYNKNRFVDIENVYQQINKIFYKFKAHSVPYDKPAAAKMSRQYCLAYLASIFSSEFSRAIFASSGSERSSSDADTSA